jgi:hypothetical protein
VAAAPVTARDFVTAYRADPLFEANRDDPEFGYRLLVDDAAAGGHPMAERTASAVCLSNRWWSRPATYKPPRGAGPRSRVPAAGFPCAPHRGRCCRPPVGPGLTPSSTSAAFIRFVTRDSLMLEVGRCLLQVLTRLTVAGTFTTSSRKSMG